MRGIEKVIEEEIQHLQGLLDAIDSKEQKIGMLAETLQQIKDKRAELDRCKEKLTVAAKGWESLLVELEAELQNVDSQELEEISEEDFDFQETEEISEEESEWL